MEYYPLIWSTISEPHTKCKYKGVDFATSFVSVFEIVTLLTKIISTPNVDHRFQLILVGDEGQYFIAIGAYLH